jgi:hypothetical protein
MVFYSDTEIEKYNPRHVDGFVSNIYQPLVENGDVYNSTNNNIRYLDLIRWICESGTPCSGISPKVMGSPSVYYFLFEITSNVKTDSYCQYKTQFTIALLNVPIPFSIEISIMALSTLFWFIPLGVYLWFTQKPDFEDEFFDEKGVKFASKKGNIKSQKNPLRKGKIGPKRVFPMDDDEEDDDIESSEEHSGSDEEDYEGEIQGDSGGNAIESDFDDDSDSDIAAYVRPIPSDTFDDKPVEVAIEVNGNK